MDMLKDLPTEERPREKGLRYGAEALSNRELLALLIRCGIRGQSALATADLLLKKAGGLKGISRLSRRELCSIRGISAVKALELQACLELSRRISFEEISDTDILDNPDKIVKWLRLKLGHRTQEEVVVLFLDAVHHLKEVKTLFIGTANASLASPKDIFEAALSVSASEIVLVHNHPSGSLEPSEADEMLTERVKKAGHLMGIQLLDHLIVTSGGYFSFAKEGFL